MRDARWPSGAIAAEFDDEEALAHAARALDRAGYARIETYSPYPVLDVEGPLYERRSRLPVVVFLAGLAGAALGYSIQWYANAVSYPLNIGGRPAHATPAFIIPTFEATVLCASLAAFIGLFWSLRLPRPWHPMFEASGFDRASIDRYWIAIDVTDNRADPRRTSADLAALGARRVVRVPSIE
jgi:hypothetical protein